MGIDTHIMPTIQVGGHRGGQRKVEPLYSEVDEDDIERVSNYKWSINKTSNQHTKYATTISGGTKLYLHRLIMGLGDFKDDKRIVDHKDGNGLNNKKSNLIVCDTLYNSQSFRGHNRNFGLVYFDTSMKRVKRWRAAVTINKQRHQKRFETEAEAIVWLESIRPLR